MKIVGHRGAAGLVTENTLESIKKAMGIGVDYVEFDVHLTKDNQLVLHHDPTLKQVTGKDLTIQDMTLNEVQAVKTKSGLAIPSLFETLQCVGDYPVFIEIKSFGGATHVAEALKNFPRARIGITSFKHVEAIKMSRIRPDLPTHAASQYNPFAALKTARLNKLAGITIHWWTLNPLTYWLAKRSGLNVMVYTVNNRAHANLIKYLYPNVLLCTNYPDRFVKNLR